MDRIKFVAEMEQYLKDRIATSGYIDISSDNLMELLIMARDAAEVLNEHERMRKVLSRMSREDYRGNRPQHTRDAYIVLKGVKKRA